MRSLNGDWDKVVDWSWDNFMKGSMENTHNVLLTGMKHKACTQIKFEDFSTDYDATFERWMKIWEINPKVIPELVAGASRHDLNRLTPEQKAQHHHISGNSLSKDQAAALDLAIRSHKGLIAVIQRQQSDLNYL